MRCLLTGMNPDAVLDEGQKKIRFRKLLLKRQRLQASGGGGVQVGGDHDDDSEHEDQDLDVEDDEEESGGLEGKEMEAVFNGSLPELIPLHSVPPPSPTSTGVSDLMLSTLVNHYQVSIL
jgi:hypothetical protein